MVEKPPIVDNCPKSVRCKCGHSDLKHKLDRTFDVSDECRVKGCNCERFRMWPKYAEPYQKFHGTRYIKGNGDEHGK